MAHWVCVAARNRTHTVLAHEKRRKQWERRAVEHAVRTATAKPDEYESEAAVASQRLTDGLARLPPLYREAIEFRIKGVSHDEAAAQSQSPCSAMAMRCAWSAPAANCSVCWKSARGTRMTREPTRHLIDEEFVGYVLDDGPPDEADAIDRHLEECEDCLRELEAYYDALDEFPRQEWEGRRDACAAASRPCAGLRGRRPSG